ncbi:YD repeat-containing protein, partial [Duganella sp. CF458]|uniref:RHS repeat protein n=1 Tax=Duganella sp. CF458 TaxID=1884368 RepID=UPI0008E1636C
AMGGVTRFSYDGNGNVTARRTYVTRIDMTKWTVGTEPAVIANDQRDGMLRTVYDALNRPVFTVDGNGDAVEMKYDSVGNVLERIAYANKIPVTTAATISAMRAALDGVADAGRDVHVRNAYDSANRLQWSVDSLGQVTGFSYDIDGNLAKQVVYAQRIAAGANPSGVVAGEGDRVTLSSYDSANRLVLRVDEHGMATALEYDANSNVVKSTAFAKPLARPTAASAAPITAPAADAAHDHVVRKVYDILNREIYSIDSIGAVTETRYDSNGHAIEKIAYASPIPLATAANATAVAAALSSVADANRDVRLRYAYDLDGRLQWSADATGAVTGYAYNNLGEVVRRTVYAARFAPALGADFAAGIDAAAAAGANAALDDGAVRVYDKNGSLIWEMDATGGVTEYRYNGKGNQVEKIVYATPLDPSQYVAGSAIVAPAANAQDVHQYQVFDAAGQLSWSIDGMGGATNFTYDGEGNVVSRVTYATPIDISKWVAGSDPAVVSDPARDNVTRTVYDAARRPLFTIDGMGQVTGVKYDGNGNVVESRIYAKRIPLATAATLAAVQGALVADDANDLRTQKVFDADNRLVMESDSKGVVTAYSHDSFGNVVKTISYTTPLATGADIHSVHAAANDRVSLVNYDADSRIVSTVDPTGQVTTYEYDANGNKVKTTVFGNRVARPTAGSSPALADSVQAEAGKDLVAQSVFDGAGNEIFSIGHTGLLTARKFDSHGDVIESITYHKPVDSSVNASKESLSALATANADAANDLRTRYVYDNSGREIWSVDQAGTAIKHVYNGAGKVSETSTYTHRVSDEVEITDAALQNELGWPSTSYRWSYDAAGRVASTTVDFAGYSNGPAGEMAIVTSYAYDGIGNETGRKVSNVYGGAAHNSVLHTVYNAQNRAVYTLDISGNVVAFKYDLRGNVIEKTAYASRVSTASLFKSPVLDDYFGQLGEEAAGTASIAFDSATSAANINAAVTAVADASRDVVTRRVFDHAGRLLWDVSSEGKVTAFTYDVEGHVTKQVQYATALAVGAEPHAAATNVQDKVQLFAYDSEGRQVLHVDHDGYVTSKAYDADGNVTETVRYTNRVARPTAASTAPQAGTLPVAVDALRDDWSRSVYDPAGREVFRLNSKGELVQWTYDGNTANQTVFINTIDPSTAATVAALSAAAASIADDANDGHLSQVFDADGRLIADTNAYGGTTRYYYGSDGRLIETIVPKSDSAPGGNESLQGYDLYGQLVYGYDTSSNRKYSFYDASHNLVRTHTSGSLPREWENRVPYGWEDRIPAIPDVVKSMVYDAAGRVIWTGIGSPVPLEASAVRYDAHGNVIETVTYADTKGLYEASSLVSASPYGGMRPIVDLSGINASRLAAGGKASFDLRTHNVYNDQNQLVYSEQAGIVTALTYDDQGNVVKKVQSATKIVPGSDPSRVSVSTEDRITLMAYDADHHLTLQVNPDGAVTRQRFDAYGNMLEHAEYMSTVDDVAALAAAWANPAVRAQLPVAPSAVDRISHYAYDSQDRLVYSVDILGAVKRTEYDSHGNAIAEVLFKDHIGARAGVGFADYSVGGLQALFNEAAAGDHTSSYTYDAMGQVRSTTDTMGATDYTTYGVNGRKATFTDKEGFVWNYEYDGEGRLAQEIGPEVPGKNGNYRTVTEYVFNGNGNMVVRSVKHDNSQDYEDNVDGFDIRYIYDHAGRPCGTVTPESMHYGSDLGTEPIWSSLPARKGPRYNALGQVDTTSTEMGSDVRRFYDESGLLKYELDLNGGVTAYERNVFGDVLVTTRYAVALSNDQLAGFASMDTAALDQIVAGMDHVNDRVITNKVDHMGRVLESQQPQGYVYDPTAPAGQQYYQAGIKTVRDYDTFGNLLTTATINSFTGVQTVEASWYDVGGKVLAKVSNTGFMVSYQYDDFGNKISATESATAIAGWKGDYAPMPVAPQDGRDRITTFEYDEAQRITRETLNDRAHFAIENGGYVKTSEYDKKGNVVIANSWGPGQTGSNSPTFMSYDGMGRMIAVLDGLRPIGDGFALTINHYGVSGGVIESIQYEKGFRIDGQLVPDESEELEVRRTRIVSDYAGRAVGIYDADHIWHYVTYDAAGNKIDERVEQYDYYNGGFNPSASYDHMGRLSTDPEQGLTLKYNTFGELIYKKQGEQEFSYEYDRAGHLWRTDESGHVQIFMYDLLGQRTAMLESGGISNGNSDLSQESSVANWEQATNVRRTEYYYDSEGRCIREVQPTRQGQRPESLKAYDHWGNLLQESQPVVAGNPAPTVTYTYDLKNRKLSESQTKADGTAGGRVREYSYVFGERGVAVVRQTIDRENATVAGPQDNDSLHVRYRQTVENYNLTGQLLSTIVNGIKAEEHTYDVFGQLRSDIIGGRVVCTYEYNGVGLLAKQTYPQVDTWRFDVAGHSVVSDGQRAMSKTFEYDGRGNLVSITTSEGVTTWYTHDAQGNLTSTTDALDNTSYTTWDKSGHKKTTTDALKYTVTNEYDKLGRLKKVTGADGSVTINEYDNAGLLVRSTQASKGQVVEYTYDDACQVATIHELVTGMSAAANTNRWTFYAYDAVGNRISEVQEQNGQTFQR